MFRLFLVWFLLTCALVGFRYFVDKTTKVQTKKWSTIFLGHGLVVAAGLGLIVFLERL